MCSASCLQPVAVLLVSTMSRGLIQVQTSSTKSFGLP
jgi:hypothetical protein